MCRTGKPYETEERQGQMSNHSTQNLQALSKVGSRLPSTKIVQDDLKQKKEASQGQSQQTTAGETKKTWPTVAGRK